MATLAFLGCGKQSPTAVENQALENTSLAKQNGGGGGEGILKEFDGITYEGATAVITDPSDGTEVTYCSGQQNVHFKRRYSHENITDLSNRSPISFRAHSDYWL